MKISVDMNVLVRLLDPVNNAQQKLAIETLRSAELVVIDLHALCEFVWVMERSFGASRHDITASIRIFLNTRNVVLNRPAVEAGLRLLAIGGDFADGAIAFDGNWLGGETFVSFEKKAVKLLTAQGAAARLLE